MKQAFIGILISVAFTAIMFFFHYKKEESKYLKVYDKDGNVVSKSYIEGKEVQELIKYEPATEYLASWVAELYLKQIVINPEEIKFKSGTQNVIQTGDEFAVSGQLTTKNDYGVIKSARYHIDLKYKGGDPNYSSNWEIKKADVQ